MYKRILIINLIVASIVNVTLAGCAMLDTSTQVRDADAKMNLGEYKGVKHAIGVKDFDNQAGWHGQWKLGYNLAIMLESALYDSGRFVVVDRSKLQDIIAEQDLVTSGRAAKAKDAARTGYIRPARYLATGAVTTVEEGQSGSGGGIAIKGVALAGAKSYAQITIIVKIIDTTTSEIVAKKQVVGKAGRVKFGVGILGTVRGHGFGIGFGGFEKTPLGEAAQDCINQAVMFIAQTMESRPAEGCVVKVSEDGKIIINRGSEFGIETGMTFVMRQEGELLTDPNTGEILGREQGKILGKIKVSRVTEKLSYCDVIEGTKDPPAGTVVIATTN